MIKHITNIIKATVLHVVAKRSSHWPTVKNKFVKSNPKCAACGSTTNLDIHHIKPFHLHPDLELDTTNLITLCMDNHCHLLIGHGNSFKAYNPNIIEDAKTVNQNIAQLKPILTEVAMRAKRQRLYE